MPFPSTYLLYPHSRTTPSSLPTDTWSRTPLYCQCLCHHWFCLLQLLSGLRGLHPTTLDQTVPCRVRESACSTTSAESGPACQPLGPWSQSDLWGLLRRCLVWPNDIMNVFWLPRTKQAQRCHDEIRIQGLEGTEGLDRGLWKNSSGNPKAQTV